MLAAAVVCVYRAGWGDVAIGAAAAFGTVLALACVGFWITNRGR